MRNNPEDYVLVMQEDSEMLDALMEKASNMSAEEWGDFTGQVVYEVVEGFVTAGVAKAKYAKYAGKAADLAKAEKGFEKTVEVGKTVKQLEKTTDVGKPLKLGEVTYVTDEVRLLPPPKNTTHSLKEIRNMRGKDKWVAGEKYVQELYGSDGQRHFPVPEGGGVTGSGGRFVDAPVDLPNKGVDAIEVKTYNKYVTINGKAKLNEVPLSDKIKQQILKDKYLKDNVPGYNPKWIFLDGPPSPELTRFLNENGIVSVVYN